MYEVHPADTTTRKRFEREPGRQHHTRPLELGGATLSCILTRDGALFQHGDRGVGGQVTMDGLSNIQLPQSLHAATFACGHFACGPSPPEATTS